VSKPTHRYLSP